MSESFSVQELSNEAKSLSAKPGFRSFEAKDGSLFIRTTDNFARGYKALSGAVGKGVVTEACRIVVNFGGRSVSPASRRGSRSASSHSGSGSRSGSPAPSRATGSKSGSFVMSPYDDDDDDDDGAPPPPRVTRPVGRPPASRPPASRAPPPPRGRPVGRPPASRPPASRAPSSSGSVGSGVSTSGKWPTAYQAFCDMQRGGIKAENPTWTKPEIQRTLHDMWHDMTAAEKKEYDQYTVPKTRAAPRPSGYSLFAQATRVELKRTDPGMSGQALVSMIGAMWSALPESKKTKWESKAHDAGGLPPRSSRPTGSSSSIKADRPSPPFPAKDHPGATKRGGDGEWWTSVPRALNGNPHGTYVWKRTGTK